MATIYGSAISPYVRKVIIFCEEKGLAYNVIPLPPHNDNVRFQEISPLGLIPAFEDKQVSMSDSTIICQYLEQFSPPPKLIPDEKDTYVKTLWLNEYATKHFSSMIIKPYAHYLIRPKILKVEYDRAIGDEALRNEIPNCFDYLESQISSNYFVGDKISLADISIGSFMQCYTILGYDIDVKRHPRLRNLIIQLYERKSFKAALDAAFKSFNACGVTNL